MAGASTKTREGWLVWRNKRIDWKHQVFKSKTDLTLSPHFEVTVTGDGSKAITFPAVEVKDVALTSEYNLLALPEQVLQKVLDNAVDAWEKEYGKP